MYREENNFEKSRKPKTPPAPPFEMKKRISGLIRNLGFPILFSIVYPLAVYYGLRALGVNAFSALLIGALPILGFQLYQMIKKRKIDFLVIFTLAILGFSVAMTFITGNARFMLAKGGFFTAVIGSGFLASLLFKRPLVFTIAAYLLQQMKVSKNHLNALWTSVPNFRHVWRISTVIWGVGILLNAVIVVLMAYFLPIDTVPVLNAVVNFMIFILLQVITSVYYKRQGIWKLVFNENKMRF